MVVKLLKGALLAVIVLGFFQDIDAQNNVCRCKIERTCDGTTEDHYDLMPDEFAVPIRGRRWNRRTENEEKFCQYRCLNLLKSYLCTSYDPTTRDRPDNVILGTVGTTDFNTAAHRICQGFASSTPSAGNTCEFNLRHGPVGLTLDSTAIGSVRCLALEYDTGNAASTVILNYAADDTANPTQVSYLSNLDLNGGTVAGQSETASAGA